jgi:hypothetical protein
MTVAPLQTVPPLQVDPATGGPLALFGTFVLAAVFYSITLHIAARYVLGDAPVGRAFYVGVLLALVAVLLQRRGPAVVIAATVTFDAFLISAIYRLSWKSTALVTVIHYTVSVLVGITIYNLIALISTAPA